MSSLDTSLFVDNTKLNDHSPLETLARKTSVKGRSLYPPNLTLAPPAFGIRSDSPSSPLLHTGFRASTDSKATYRPKDSYYSVDSYYPPSPSLSDFVDHDAPVTPQQSDPPSVVHSAQPIISPSRRSPIQYDIPPTNYSRPTFPRTPESERAKRDVLERVKSTRNVESSDRLQTTFPDSPSPLAHKFQTVPPSATLSSGISPYNHPSNSSEGAYRYASSTPKSVVQGSPIPSGSKIPAPSTYSYPTNASFIPYVNSHNPAGIPLTQPSKEPLYVSTSSSLGHGTCPEVHSPSQYSSSSSHAQSDYPATPTSADIHLDEATDSKVRNTADAPYDRYSYYELSTPLPDSAYLNPRSLRTPANVSSPSRITMSGKSTSTVTLKPELRTAEDYLMLGIELHLVESASSLLQSAEHFHKSATLDGGCGLGMLMWGLCLRHGWGIAKDEKQAFRWLKQACELAVGDLEKLDEERQTRDIRSSAHPSKQVRQEVKAELILAIYEVGQCFFQGWGVRKDRVMGFNYFLMAARLGDIDAQQELGYCYSNGKGCKKDRREAARWYRAAAEQGASTVGLAWIYKEKYT